MTDAAEVVSILKAAAASSGLPPLLVIACAYAESRLNPLGRRPSDPTKYRQYWAPPDPFDVSGGLGQKIVRYMQPYLDWCKAHGHNPDDYPGDDVIDAMLDLLNDPAEAARIMCADLVSKWRIYGPNLEKTLAAYNWPAGGGAFYSPEHAANYRTGLEAAARILGEKPNMADVIYNPDQPPERQIQDWVCSIRAATWVLKSLGVNVDAGQMQDEMVPKYVTPELGLLDGKGYGLAEALRRHLPAGTRVEVVENATWGDLVSRAGRGPIALGLHGAYHWVNVARVKGAQLDAPNPAPNYPASAPIGDQLTQDEFNAFGPASLVFVDVGAGAVADPRDARIAQLEAEKAQLVTVIGYLTGDVARAIEAANNELKRHAPAA